MIANWGFNLNLSPSEKILMEKLRQYFLKIKYLNHKIDESKYFAQIFTIRCRNVSYSFSWLSVFTTEL